MVASGCSVSPLLRTRRLGAGLAGADVSVSFRTLDGSAELYFRPEVEYHAASTMKIPVMIELFHQARAGSLKLDDEMLVVNQFHSIVDGSPFTLSEGDDSDADVYKKVGSRMSYRDLCDAMITVSSNFATNLLIERLGAKLDGILRNHQVATNGTLRDTVVYSIIASEWPTVRAHLTYQLNEKPR